MVALAFFGIVFSLFYGVYAITIWLRFPKFPDPNKAIDRKQAWQEGWFDILLHPRYVHEFWFNFAASALGWTALQRLQWFYFHVRKSLAHYLALRNQRPDNYGIPHWA